MAKQIRCVYGTCDAGSIWEDTYRDALEGLGVTSGLASPCCFWHKQRNISTVVHGDDITTLALGPDLDWLQEGLSKSFELKIRGCIGVGLDGDNEMRILNRIAHLVPDGLIYEADPRHTDILSNSLGLTAANSCVTPGVKDVEMDPDVVKTNEPEGIALVQPKQLQFEPWDDADKTNSIDHEAMSANAIKVCPTQFPGNRMQRDMAYINSLNTNSRKSSVKYTPG